MKISKVLPQVRLLKVKYDELAAATGENFNIFSILRIKRRCSDNPHTNACRVVESSWLAPSTGHFPKIILGDMHQTQ